MPPVIIDVGSASFKAGLQTDAKPRAIFPSIIGRPRRRFESSFEGTPTFVGNQALEQRSKLAIFNPVDHGHIENWTDMEALWTYTFEDALQVDPAGEAVLLTEPPMASSEHRSRMVESMVECFDVSEVCLGLQGILALYAVGKTTGLVVEIGEGVTQIVPVHEGFTNKAAIRRSDFGGGEITMYLQKMLCENGYLLTTRSDLDHVINIKEQLCYTALDPIEEDSRANQDGVVYQLPDNTCLRDGTTSITVGNERFYCVEALFEPRLVQRDNVPLADLVWQAVQASPIEIRKQSLSSVILSGGGTAFKGFPERLEKELKRLSPPQARSVVKVHANDERLLGVWLGAKIFCEPTMRPLQESFWISKEEWLEYGPNAVEIKTPFRR